MSPHAGQRIAGKYRLDRAIAEGGMGSVWMADHEALGARIAVKFIAPLLASDATARLRFEREAKMAARLQSPHVVHVIDYGIEGEQPYIAMEYLAGETLEHHLARVGARSLAETARIVEQIAKAIGLAHAEGIVHRDLKPSNVFLAEIGGETIVKVCDFGIAKQVVGAPLGDETTTGTVLGSPHAMSPEQARGGIIDHRSDVWSLGVIAFRMLTGRRPFDGANLGDVLVRICTDPIPRASAYGAFSADVDAFFARAFERDPARRFQSARALADALTALAHDPVATVARAATAPVLGRDGATAVLGRDAATAELSGAPAPTSAATAPAAQTSAATSTTASTATPAPARTRWRLAALVSAVAATGIALAVAFARHDADPRAATATPSAAPSGTDEPARPARPDPSPATVSAPPTAGTPQAATVSATEARLAEPARVAPTPVPTAPAKGSPGRKRPPAKRDEKRTDAPGAKRDAGPRYDPFSGLPTK